MGGSITAPTSDACFQKAILTHTDSMLGLSYMASCAYVTDVAINATKKDSSCDKLGDGFIYLFGAHGSIGVLYFFVIIVGIKGKKQWDRHNYADESRDDSQRFSWEEALGDLSDN